MAAADAAAASRNTSRGWTIVVSSDPIDSTAVRIRRCFVSSITMPKCSTGRVPYSGSRYAASAWRGVEARALAGRHRQRAAAELDGGQHLCRATRPDPGTRRQSAAVARARPRSPPVWSSSWLASDSASACREPLAEHDRQQFVVAESGGSEAIQLLAGPILTGDPLHRRG